MARPSTVLVGGAVVYRQELPAVPSTVPWARWQAREVLRSWRVPPDTVETTELLLTEIVTNAIRHGGSQHAASSVDGTEDRIMVILRHRAGELFIEVSDSNQIPPVLADPDDHAEGWRGLNIVNDLSLKWGYYHLRPLSKSVYCVVAYD